MMPSTTPPETPQTTEVPGTPPDGTGAPENAARRPPTGEQCGDDNRDTSDVAALRREAGQRRRQLREVEAERDTLRERVDASDRAAVERVAATQLADPADLWIACQLDELRDDAGALDDEKVTAALADALRRKPHWRRPTEPLNTHAGARPEPPESPSFGAALKRASGGSR